MAGIRLAELGLVATPIINGAFIALLVIPNDNPEARPEVTISMIAGSIVWGSTSAWVLRRRIRPMRFLAIFVGGSLAFFALPFLVGFVVGILEIAFN